MAEIVESIEISRRPEEVFEYATDFTHFPEWQLGVISARREDDGPVSLGRELPSSGRLALGSCPGPRR
jgi:hypothetical protein